MPKMSLNAPIPIRTIPSGDVRMSVRAAGAVPSTGAPQASYPAGTYDFETHILIAKAEPVVNRGAFPGRLSETLRDADINVGTAPAATIAISAPAPVSAAESQAIATAWNTNPVGVQGSWYSITGRVTAPAAFQTAALNRAIARAFANNATFPTTLGSNSANAKLPRPSDGSLLLAALSAPNACTGGRDYAKVYAAACTRIGLAATLQPTSQGTANYSKTSGPVMTPTSQGTANYSKPATTTGTSTPVTTTTTPRPSQPSTPAVRQESAIQTRPPVVVTTTPVVPPPAAPQAEQSSSVVPYVAAGGVAVAVGLAIWKRKAIASWLR